MKRSEMVTKIFEKLMMLYHANLSTMEVSDELLKEMEKEGMLPPFDSNGIRVNKEALKYCKWEPEDE